jgi:outer membrane murein-binding lipoprotein Lpp
MNDKIGISAWVTPILQVLAISGSLFAFFYVTFPSKGYIDSKIEFIDSKIQSLDSKIESLETNLEADIKELQDDVDQLNQNYINHLAFHVDKP